jgi:hypothetical protein
VHSTTRLLAATSTYFRWPLGRRSYAKVPLDEGAVQPRAPQRQIRPVAPATNRVEGRRGRRSLLGLVSLWIGTLVAVDRCQPCGTCRASQPCGPGFGPDRKATAEPHNDNRLSSVKGLARESMERVLRHDRTRARFAQKLIYVNLTTSLRLSELLQDH